MLTVSLSSYTWFARTAFVRSTYVLLNILLASIDSALAHLEAHLCGGIVHEASKSRMHVVPLALALALPLGLRW